MRNTLDCLPNEDYISIERVLSTRALNPVFQPIVDFRANAFLGYEGLIRGPYGTHLQRPDHLFQEAQLLGLGPELEVMCLEILLDQHAGSYIPGRLFLNVTPSLLLTPYLRAGVFSDRLKDLNISPSRIVFELTENQKITDLPGVLDAITHYRSQGFQFAIDDLGEGFSNLRMWSDLRPEFVKIDKHFIKGIATDRIKFHFVRAMQDLAEICRSSLIAEGIETEADFLCVRDMGISCCQGFFVAQPAADPPRFANAQTIAALSRPRLLRGSVVAQATAPSARSLLRELPALSVTENNDAALAHFTNDAQLDVLPVVRGEQPIGMLNRHVLADRFARPFQKELFGKRSCDLFMDQAPLIVDQTATIQELAMMLALAPKRYLLDGFIITDKGRYLGVGSSHHLMALITEMQISAARYANPLTQLPGNVPTNEHIDSMLQSRLPFVAAYVDIDNFKPFNDNYGYRRGDDVIQLLGQMLLEHVDPTRDFVGHIGGDDFFVVFQSPDWEQRCWDIIATFGEAMATLVGQEDYASGGYMAENRKGEVVFQSLPTLSAGAVRVLPGEYDSHREVSSAAAIAKKQAKKAQKNSEAQKRGAVFMERRHATSLVSVVGEIPYYLN
ncbi:MAG: hypothetical protein RIR18_1585 [Pseudomonadota bacterium]